MDFKCGPSWCTKGIPNVFVLRRFGSTLRYLSQCFYGVDQRKDFKKLYYSDGVSFLIFFLLMTHCLHYTNLNSFNSTFVVFKSCFIIVIKTCLGQKIGQLSLKRQAFNFFSYLITVLILSFF